jgi:hypothetical protein
MSVIPRLKWVLFVCLAGVLCTACQVSSMPLPVLPSPTEVHGPELSQAARLPSPTDTRVQPSATSLPSQTPTPLATKTPVPQATPTASATAIPACREQATFVRHLNISPRTLLPAGQIMGKVWRVQNSGDCTWTPEYSLVFDHGEPMSNGKPVPLPSSVPPGATVDLRFSLVVPQKPGEYSGYWLLQAPNGETFGTGPQGSEPLVVQIVVRDPNAPKPFNFCGG